MTQEIEPKKLNINNFEEYRSAWQQAIKAKFLSDFPLHIDIELTSDCNLKCKMCWQYKDPDAFPRGFMKEKLFKKIIDEGMANGLCAIKLQSRGEAMMHPKIFEYSRYAKDKGVMDIHLTTNGTLFLKKGKINELFESGIDKLIFSIDDAHDESVEEIYKNKKPNVREYFNEIGKIKKERNLKKPFLVAQTFCDENYDINKKKSEIIDMYPMANDVNINYLWESLPEKESLKNLQKDYEFLPCAYLWSRILVFWDGLVTTCCRDYSGKNMTLGDANNDEIKKLWNSSKMRRFRKLHFENKRSNINLCAKCEISTIKKINSS
tara:strand:- start:300 stop:1262 length:963 start_codon:yes stop_codon:yes gene_type:complete